MPIRIRRSRGSGTAACSGECGCSRAVVATEAETMKRPSPAASIKYSGQWVRIASTGDRMGERPSPAASEGARRRLAHLSGGDGVTDSDRVLPAIACSDPDFLRRLMARTAAPARNRHCSVLVLDLLTAGARHHAIAAWAAHGSLLPGFLS